MAYSKNFNRKKHTGCKLHLKWLYIVLSVILWLHIWHFCAIRIGNVLFLPKPSDVIKSLIKLVTGNNFRETVTYSLLNITKGFLLAVSIGTCLACLSRINPFIKSFIDFPMKVIKSTPVASFTILALLWVSSDNLSVLVSFLMGLPIIYANVVQGACSTDKKLLEMSRIFRFGIIRRIRYVYAANIAPYFISACSVTAGMCWKSGIAAELIGLARNSIGNRLYQAKLYLEIPELFAYTFVIIIMSIIFEKLSILIFRLLFGLITHSAYIRHPVTSVAKLHRRPFHVHFAHSLRTHRVPDSPCSIELRNISKSYGDNMVKDNVVFDNFSLLIEGGKTTAIMSPSGSGKTTLVNIISGLTDADGGTVTFSEKPYISMVFQEDRLLEQCDVITNLSVVSGISDINDGLKSLGLNNSIHLRISSLSGGMKRRIAILRSILYPSNIVILDEPFKGLDKELKKDVMDYVKKRTAYKTVLLITHDIDEAEYFTDTVINL